MKLPWRYLSVRLKGFILLCHALFHIVVKVRLKGLDPSKLQVPEEHMWQTNVQNR